MNEDIKDELRRSSDTIAHIDPGQIRKAADIVYECVKRKGQVFFMGNGGSSADAQHIAAELSGRYAFDRPAMAGVCLSNIAPVTAIANDYSYDIVFSRQIEAFCRKGDVVVGLSTSGNSNNVVLALEAAKKIGASTISFTGDGGKMKGIVDHAVIIPTKETPRIQEGYLVACHTVCRIVEQAMFGRSAVLVDRDNTLCKDIPYLDDPGKMQVYPWVPEAVARLNHAGLDVIVVTNQSGIGRGKFTEKILAGINAVLVEQIRCGGGKIRDILSCLHHPDDKCACRKPEVGMGLTAAKKYGLDMTRCYMVGDADKDMEFGKRLGMHTIRIEEGTNFSDAVDRIMAETKSDF